MVPKTSPEKRKITTLILLLTNMKQHTKAPTVIPPPATPTFLKLSFPAPGVVLVTMSRPKDHNCMNRAATLELESVWAWLDAEPSLIVAIITGAGSKAFSTGADLKEWNKSYLEQGPSVSDAVGTTTLSRRRGKKPVIAAVNGLAVGGGTEFVVNCDLVVASETAKFGLPEVKRGLIPFAGALPRMIRSIGLQRASEMALTGRFVTAQEMFSWGLVNQIVPQDQVVDEAIKYAKLIVANSPDAIIAARAGIRQGWESASVDTATELIIHNEWAKLLQGDNVREGLRAFDEKRPPAWQPSKL